jgi:hypothetical protein
MFLALQGYLYFPCFLMLLVLVQRMKIYCTLYIASYHYYPLVEIYLCQSYFNMSLTYEHVLFHVDTSGYP